MSKNKGDVALGDLSGPKFLYVDPGSARLLKNAKYTQRRTKKVVRLADENVDSLCTISRNRHGAS